jgi:hypothetical protein
MSIYREAEAYYGWIIDLDAFYELCEERKEVTHMEPRYDSKTGESVGDVLVVDEKAGHYWKGQFLHGYRDICGWVQEWLNEQKCGLSIEPMQHQDGDFSQLIIGLSARNKLPDQLVFEAEDAKFILDNFKVSYPPRIAAFLSVG